MTDTTFKVRNSLLQHGPHNDRVYIMKLDARDTDSVIARAEELARENGYSKIFAKIPLSQLEEFTARGFMEEARIPAFNETDEGVAFASRFLSGKREKPRRTPQIMRVKAAAQKSGIRPKLMPVLPPEYTLSEATLEDCANLAQLYIRVFPSYPFPISDADFLRTNLEAETRYFQIKHGADLVAASAAEMDRSGGTVEMTDFATLPDHRGKQLALILLGEMEAAMAVEPVSVAYTIARAVSFGMNITFGKAGYEFAGTLRNNTNISGDIESMNVWYKNLTHNR